MEKDEPAGKVIFLIKRDGDEYKVTMNKKCDAIGEKDLVEIVFGACAKYLKIEFGE